MIGDINLDWPLGKSDHSVIMFAFNSYITGNATPKTRYDKGDYTNMEDFLKIKHKQRLWNKCLQTGNDKYKHEYNRIRITLRSFGLLTSQSQKLRALYQICIKMIRKKK